MKTRDPIFDVMKGVGIVLMLIGHVPPGEHIYHFIYSFHMPLFFLVAGSFVTSVHNSKDVIVKDAKRLLLPVFVTMAFILGLSPLYYFIDGNFHNVIVQVLSLLWMGDAFNTKWGWVTIDSMWFLTALFWVRCLFRYIAGWCERINKYKDEIILGICIIISFAAISLQKIMPPIPFGLLKGLSAIQFYAIGWYLKHHKLPQWMYGLFVGCWLAALRFGGLDMVRYYYGCYPLDVIGAVGATIVVYVFSKVICARAGKVGKFFQWLGINSLLILCVNTLDRKTCVVRAIKYAFGLKIIGISSVLFHYAIEIVLIVVIVHFSLFKSIYGTKQWKEI